jgi:uncharacterized membrane protein
MTKRQAFGWLFLLVISTVQVSAQKKDVQEVTDIGQIEEIKSEGVKPTALELAGRFHPMLIHFPIAWLILLALAELFSFIGRQTYWWQPVLCLHVLALLAFVPAAVTGFILAAHIGTDPEFLRLVIPHRNLNLAGAALCLISLVLRIRAGKDMHGRMRRTVLLLILSATLAVLIASHYGGEMVFGESFLPF